MEEEEGIEEESSLLSGTRVISHGHDLSVGVQELLKLYLQDKIELNYEDHAKVKNDLRTQRMNDRRETNNSMYESVKTAELHLRPESQQNEYFPFTLDSEAHADGAINFTQSDFELVQGIAQNLFTTNEEKTDIVRYLTSKKYVVDKIEITTLNIMTSEEKIYLRVHVQIWVFRNGGLSSQLINAWFDVFTIPSNSTKLKEHDSIDELMNERRLDAANSEEDPNLDFASLTFHKIVCDDTISSLVYELTSFNDAEEYANYLNKILLNTRDPNVYIQVMQKEFPLKNQTFFIKEGVAMTMDATVKIFARTMWINDLKKNIGGKYYYNTLINIILQASRAHAVMAQANPDMMNNDIEITFDTLGLRHDHLKVWQEDIYKFNKIIHILLLKLPDLHNNDTSKNLENQLNLVEDKSLIGWGKSVVGNFFGQRDERLDEIKYGNRVACKLICDFVFEACDQDMGTEEYLKKKLGLPFMNDLDLKNKNHIKFQWLALSEKYPRVIQKLFDSLPYA